MAKSEFYIMLDFRNTMRQADRLEELGNRIKDVANKDLVNCRSSLSANWKGENATAYLKKVQKVEGNIASIGEKLKNTAEVLREIAQRTYDTEMWALEKAKKREYW
ncbi:MAG: WXG100 family type VII secretion target [Lachnospiraceae bacterium]|nr:WXG100 family type VII secretion target [Lachnospiraceae bacterium]